MTSVKLVIAVGQNDKDRHAANPAAEVSEKVKRCRIGPVNVIEDEHCRLGAALQLSQERAEDGEPAVGGANELEQVPFGLERDVVQRTERLRREERISAAEQNACFPLMGGKEAFDEGGLADSRLSMNKADATEPSRGLAERVLQSAQSWLALQDLHEIG
jgi:hypothetical protein